MKNKLLFLLTLVLLLTVLPACSSAPTVPLPRSMKGYELYSWQNGGEWYFTLITGTNRNKSLEEITSEFNTESPDGWVDIHAVGIEEIKAILHRIPAGEFVIWAGGGFVQSPEAATAKLVLPTVDTVNEIKEYANQLGLDFTVSGF
jgi:ABC-type glycerol-3-phosphate transport system substrate-binding protein